MSVSAAGGGGGGAPPIESWDDVPEWLQDDIVEGFVMNSYPILQQQQSKMLSE